MEQHKKRVINQCRARRGDPILAGWPWPARMQACNDDRGVATAAMSTQRQTDREWRTNREQKYFLGTKRKSRSRNHKLGVAIAAATVISPDSASRVARRVTTIVIPDKARYTTTVRKRCNEEKGQTENIVHVSLTEWYGPRLCLFGSTDLPIWPTDELYMYNNVTLVTDV